ncbi:MAG: sigma-70 family RNA polymerase sigma factor [Candidatus Saccharimonadales bacterium]
MKKTPEQNTLNSPPESDVYRDAKTKRLFAIVDGGVDREAAMHEYRTLDKADILPNELIYERLTLYKKHATSEAVDAHKQLVELHAPLAYYFANKYVAYLKYAEKSDLEQEAWAAMSEAIWTYDPERGTRLSTHAYPRIQGRMQRIIHQHGYLVHIPENVAQKYHRARRANPSASPFEIADQRDLDTVGMLAVGHTFAHIRSLDGGFGTRYEYFDLEGRPTRRMAVDGDIEETYVTNTHGEMMDEILHELVLQEGMQILLESLSTREREILELRFGLADGIPKTLAEVGATHGITGQRVRQIEAKALTKMRFIVLPRQHLSGDPLELLPSLESPKNDQQAPRISQTTSIKKEEEANVRTRLQLLQAREHAFGDYLEQIKGCVHNVGLLPIGSLIELVLADDPSSQLCDLLREVQQDGAPGIDIRKHRQLIGGTPDVRIPAVAQYLDEFIEKLRALPDPAYEVGWIRQRREEQNAVYALILAEREANSPALQKALQNKYAVPRKHIEPSEPKAEHTVDSAQAVSQEPETYVFTPDQEAFLEELITRYASSEVEVPDITDLFAEALKYVGPESGFESVEWYVVDRL